MLYNLSSCFINIPDQSIGDEFLLFFCAIVLYFGLD